MKLILRTIFIIAVFTLIAACSNEKNKQPRHFKIQVAKKHQIDQNLKIVLKQISSFDSLEVLLNSKVVKHKVSGDSLVEVDASLLTCNDYNVKIKAFKKGEVSTSNKRYFKVFGGQQAKELSWSIVNTFNHDVDAYTQGLFYQDGIFYESTGMYGESDIRKVDPKTGDVLKKIELDTEYFAEGLAVYGDSVFQLTWREKKGYIYNKEDYRLIGEFEYQHEGWGIDSDQEYLYVSDGTSTIRIWNPHTQKTVSSFKVRSLSSEFDRINELEVVGDFIWANVYTEDYLLKIDKRTGAVLAKINLNGLLKEEDKTMNTDVLNGIAYNPEKSTFFVTGKRWPKLFEIEIDE